MMKNEMLKINTFAVKILKTNNPTVCKKNITQEINPCILNVVKYCLWFHCSFTTADYFFIEDPPRNNLWLW